MKRKLQFITLFIALILSLASCEAQNPSSQDPASKNASIESTTSVPNETPSDTPLEENSLDNSTEEISDIDMLLEGKTVVANQYPTGDPYYNDMPADGTITAETLLQSAFEKYESEELFCVRIEILGNKRFELESSFLYEGKTLLECKDDSEKYKEALKALSDHCIEEEMKLLSEKGFITVKHLDGESNLFRFVAFATEELKKNTAFESGRAYKAELTSLSLSAGYTGEVTVFEN